MKQFSTLLTILLGIFLFNFNSSAQGTWDKIHTVLQTNCNASGCHGAGSPNGFTVDGNASNVYNQLINVDPTNPYARDSAKNKLIFPGDPAKSFLLRKIGNCPDGDLMLKAPEEGASMPSGGQSAIPDSTIELIRQWILYGASETGTINNEKAISDYYKNPSQHVARMEPLAPPRECEGFQVHLGPIFLQPGEEVEYFIPYDLQLDDDIEVTRLEVKMNVESHHFILYSMNPSEYANSKKGLRELELSSFGGGYINAWQNDDTYELPNGTAFFWEKERILDLNYHIFNYNADKILPTEVYLNIYTQPKGTADKEMKSRLIPIGNGSQTSIYGLSIPPYNPNVPMQDQHVTFTEEVVWNSPDTISLFMLSTHTHSWGIGYDIYRRDPSKPGKKGEMLYNGNYNFDYSFNAGRYDWEHPAVRRMEPLVPVDMNLGLIHEATYKPLNSELEEPVGYIPGVCGPDELFPCVGTSWSFQTTGEMMLIYLQYVEGTYEIPANPVGQSLCDANDEFPKVSDPCLNPPIDTTNSIFNNSHLDEALVNVFPNPFEGTANIVVDMPRNGNLNIEVFDMLGKRVDILAKGNRQAGNHRFTFDSSNSSSNGVYFIKVTMDNKSLTKKLIEIR